MATEIFFLTLIGYGILFIYTPLLFIRLVFAFWKSREKIFKKDQEVSAKSILPLLSTVIVFVLFFTLYLVMDISTQTKWSYNYGTKYILDLIQDLKFNAYLSAAFPNILDIIRFVETNVPQPDIRTKLFMNLFPVEVLVFSLLAFMFLLILAASKMIQFLANSPFIKKLMMVDETKPHTFRIPVLFVNLFYLIPGFLLLFTATMHLYELFWSWDDQINYFMNGGRPMMGAYFTGNVDVYRNLPGNMGGFVQNGLTAPIHNTYNFYEFLIIFSYLFGSSMLLGYKNSLTQTTLEEELESKAPEVGSKVEIPPASLNQFLKEIYERYPLEAMEEGSLTRSDLSPLFELEPIRGLGPILDSKPPNFRILGLNERYPDTVYQGRYQYLDEKNQQLIWKKIIKILNLDIFYITQTKVFDNLYNNKNVILSTENLSGKTSIMLAAIFHEILQKKRTVLIVVAHDSVADEFNHTMIEKFEVEPWFSSIHKLTLTSLDNVRFQQNVSDRKPDIIFVTPELIHDEILAHPKAYKRFLEDLGLICFPDLQYLQGYEFINASFSCMRLFFLIKSIANKTRLQLAESSEIPQNVFISIGPIENALEVCKSFMGKLVNLTEISEIRDSEAPSSDKRIFGFRAKRRKYLPDPYRMLPFTLARIAISMKIKPVILLGFRDRISEADKIRAASQLECENVTRIDFEQNVLIEEDFLKFREKEIYRTHTTSLLETPLIIVSGENDRLMNFSNIFRSIGILSQHREVLVLGIVTNEESESNFRHISKLWKEYEEKRNDRFRVRREMPIPKYDSSIQELIQNHILWIIKDNFAMEDSKTRKGLFLHNIREAFQIPEELMKTALTNLEINGYIKKIEKKEYLNNRRRISFQGYTYLSNPNDEKINMRSRDRESCIPVKDMANGRVLLEIDDFERKTFYYPGTTHSIHEIRYKIVSSSNKELFVQPNKTLIESRVHFEVLNKNEIKEQITLNQNGLFIQKKYSISKFKNMTIHTFISGLSDKKIEYNQDSEIPNGNPLPSERIRVTLLPNKIINRNPFSNETISIEDIQVNPDEPITDSYTIEEHLDLFAIFLESNLKLEEDVLPILEEKIYSAVELIIDSPRSHLIITAVKEMLFDKQGVLIFFISRALYNSNIFEILENDISLVNQSENSFILESLKVFSTNLETIREVYSDVSE